MIMKRVFAFLLTVSLVISLLPGYAWAVTDSAIFAGGNGTKEAPFLVESPEALNAVRNYPESHFRQTADIDMAQWENWTPIPEFSGVYDGCEFEIQNLKITGSVYISEKTPYGLFANAKEATFKNMRLTDLNIDIDEAQTDYAAIYASGKKIALAVGGICAVADATDFVNCSVSGTIRVTNCADVTIGGIVGYGSSKTEYCHSETDITVEANQFYRINGGWSIGPRVCCGGIAGTGLELDMIYCSNAGTINAISSDTSWVGGIVATLDKGNITDCVNTGNLSCSVIPFTKDINYNSFYAGGICCSCPARTLFDCVNYGNISVCGDKEKWNSTYIGAGGIAAKGDPENCYNLAQSVSAQHMDEYAVTEYYESCFRIMAEIPTDYIYGDDGQREFCYCADRTLLNGQAEAFSSYDDWTAGGEYDKRNGFSLPAEALQNPNTYKGFDFENTWQISQELGGPVLQDMPYFSAPETPDLDDTAMALADFQREMYIARHLAYGEHDLLGGSYYYHVFTSEKSPSQIIISSHPDPEGMTAAAAAWEALNAAIDAAENGFSVAYKHDLKQQDVVCAYILGAVGAYTESSCMDAAKNNAKHVSNLISYSRELNDTFVAAGKDFKAFANEQKGTLKQLLEEYYRECDPTMEALIKTEKGSKLLEALIGKAKDFEDLYYKMTSYAKLYSLNDTTKEALFLMYEACPEEDKEIKKALKKCVEIMGAANDQMLLEMIEGKLAVSVGSYGASYLGEVFWEKATEAFLKSCPLAASYLSFAKLQTTVVDQLFGIDAQVEQYFKMCTLVRLDSIAGSAVRQALQDFRNNERQETAAVLLAAIELKFGFIDQDYQEAVKYSEIISDTGILRKARNALKQFFGANETNSLKDSLQDAEKAKNAMHYTLLTSWISALDAEDPRLAKNFYAYREQMLLRYQPELAEDLSEAYKNAARIAYINCPVNVTIYNDHGEIAAQVGEDGVWSSDDVAVLYDHGEKTVIFFRDAKYVMTCQGYADGEMDIQINTLDAQGTVVRVVNYNRIPVTANSVHEISDNQVCDSYGTAVTADCDTWDEAQSKHNLTVSQGVAFNRLIQTEVAEGQWVYITAIIPEGYQFVGWTADQRDLVFEDPQALSTLFFMPDNDVQIEAKIKRINRQQTTKNPGLLHEFPLVAVICACVTTIAVGIVFFVFVRKRKNRSKDI